MHYRISSAIPSCRYIQIEATVTGLDQETVEIQLPSWRPGRYELGNFAKNVRDFKVWDSDGREVTAAKLTKDKWVVRSKNTSAIRITYEYYGAELNAGSTYTDDGQLYMNPVNCLVYIPERIKEECVVELIVPANWKVACALKKTESNKLIAPDFDTLADSPLIASSTIKHNHFILDGVEFHLWFQGECKPDWSMLISDFFIFISEQMTLFGSFPANEYHFLFQILPIKFYHGVEHTGSTVIALGPSYKMMTDGYNDLLGVSCHELFHAWNIKAIRPAEMVPYDFTKENYSRLGYVCEGVTTYYGDYLLFRSGVWSEEEFWPTFDERMDKHFEIHARHFLSVADASFDSWLDGYTPGAPHRKTSIYHEGCLLAFVTDMFIRRHSSNSRSLDDVMRRLWKEFALKGKGYTEADYKRLIEEESGADFNYYWNNFFYKANSYEPILREALADIGVELNFSDSRRKHEDLFGFKVTEPNGATRVSEIYYGSPAEKAGLTIGDEIIGVNGIQLKADLAEWVNYLDQKELSVTVSSAGKIEVIQLKSDGRHWYQNPRVKRISKPNADQIISWEKWSGKKF